MKAVERIIPLRTRHQLMMLIIMLGVVACFGIGVIDLLSLHQPDLLRVFLLCPLLISVILLLMMMFSRLLRSMIAPIDQIESQIEELLRKDSQFHSSSSNVTERISTIDLWTRFLERVQTWASVADLQQTNSLARTGTANILSSELLDILPYGVAYFDTAGRVSQHNPSFIHMLILERRPFTTINELMRTISPWIAKEDRERALAAWNDSEQVSFTLEVKCGETVDFIRLTRKPHIINQRLVGTLITTQDVTQQRISDVCRDHFLSTATHELRTPLANIIAYAETLTINDSIEREQQKHFCNVIKSESTRLARFVDELLDINRMEAGSLTLRVTQTKTAQFLNDVCDKIRPLMHNKQIDFVSKFPEAIPELLLDQDKVASALINLLGNAVKYTPDHGRVEFRAIVLEHCLCLEVQDTGIGIASDELPQVFDKFFRSEDDRVREITGSGLGLSFTREVVRLHGGDISVQSEIGKGSTFIMTLPRP